LEFEEDGPVGGSEIRSQITEQHAELRQLLGEIEILAERFEKSTENNADVGRELLNRGRVLYEKFGAHLECEQTLLEPMLRKSGPEGERLANRLRNEHHEQRELLQYLMTRLDQHPKPTTLIARELQHFSAFLRYEMEYEEGTLLSASVLEGARS
jgi:iron-sulfur cluster repair protein YtfE (RIC family)